MPGRIHEGTRALRRLSHGLHFRDGGDRNVVRGIMLGRRSFRQIQMLVTKCGISGKYYVITRNITMF